MRRKGAQRCAYASCTHASRGQARVAVGPHGVRAAAAPAAAPGRHADVADRRRTARQRGARRRGEAAIVGPLRRPQQRPGAARSVRAGSWLGPLRRHRLTAAAAGKGHRLRAQRCTTPEACAQCALLLFSRDDAVACAGARAGARGAAASPPARPHASGVAADRPWPRADCGVSCHGKCAAQLSTACRGAGSSADATKPLGFALQPNQLLAPRPICGVLGEDLAVLCDREQRLVPYLVALCIDTVERHGLHTIGIHRIACDPERLRQWRAQLDAGRNDEAADIVRNDAGIASAALQAFLRELPDPLLPPALHGELLACDDIGDAESRLTSIRAVLLKLPPPNYATLRYIMEHLVRVAERQLENGMSAVSLADIFAPLLVRAGRASAGASSAGAVAARPTAAPSSADNPPANVVVRSASSEQDSTFDTLLGRLRAAAVVSNMIESRKHVMPAKDAAVRWASNFADMLADDDGVQLLRKFLVQEFSNDNLDFWLGVNHYHRSQPRHRFGMAQQLVTDFLMVRACRVGCAAVRLSRPCGAPLCSGALGPKSACPTT